MSRPPAVDQSGSRHTPAKLDELTRKKRHLSRSFDLLTSELPALERRRDDAATASFNGGGSRAQRQYDGLVKELAEKASEKARLEHAIAGLETQLKEERQRVADQEEARKAAAAAEHRERVIRSEMRNLEEYLKHQRSGCEHAKKLAEIELQLNHVREIVETEYDDEARRNEGPKPCEEINGLPVLSMRTPPTRTPMVSLFGLRPRPRDLGQK
jgi:hypothetical protein